MMTFILFGTFVFVVISGTVILMCVTEKKWGYTKEREQDLEKEANKTAGAFRKAGHDAAEPVEKGQAGKGGKV